MTNQNNITPAVENQEQTIGFEKQQSFINEYLIDFNAQKAAIRSNYIFPTISDGKFYTYFLIDNRDGKIFYVGKGIKDRIHSHVANAKIGNINNAIKHSKILDIINGGGTVGETFFTIEETESLAYKTERLAILSLRGCGLSNISSGLVSAEESTVEHAKIMLSNLKPYNKWIATTLKEKLDRAKRVFGDDLKAFYRNFISELDCIASGVYMERINNLKEEIRLQNRDM